MDVAWCLVFSHSLSFPFLSLEHVPPALAAVHQGLEITPSPCTDFCLSQALSVISQVCWESLHKPLALPVTLKLLNKIYIYFF